jgi:hypothetical protein
MKPSRPLTYRELARLVEGEVTASEAQAMEQILEHSPTSRRRHATVKRVVDTIGDGTEIAGIDLLPAVRRKLVDDSDRVDGSRKSPFRARMVGIAAAAALTLILPAVFLMDGGIAPEKAQPEFRRKSASGTSDPRVRWIALNVFRLSGNEAPTPLGDTLQPQDGLIFQYTNLGPSPFSYLMVFAIDEEDRVYWYYPAFLDESSDPPAIPIQTGASRVGLHEVIGHPYAEGQLTIFALFSDNELLVSDIEKSVKERVRGKGGFEDRFDGVRVKSVNVEVQP